MADRRGLLNEASDFSGTTASGNTTPPHQELPALGFTSHSHSLGLSAPQHAPPPASPPASRPGYSRLTSDHAPADRTSPPAVIEEEDEGDIADSFHSGSATAGLGLGSPVVPQTTRRVSIQSIPRRPVSITMKSPPVKSPNTLSPPGTAEPLMGGFPSDSADNTPDLRRERFSPRDEGRESPRGVLKNARKSSASLNDDYQRFINDTDGQRMRTNTGAYSIKSAYENDFRPTQECPTAKDFYHSKFTWVSVSIVIICLFSTVWSGIFLGIALKAPRWGRMITSQGSFKPSDAILLTSIMAKLIELSFVTSFVAFLGQVLSRRAFMKEHGRGVTLSELSMWRWVVQPGTLITHWETAKYAGLSVLGILSLLSATLATLYTPAATALVQPSLKFGDWDHKIMAGSVLADFGNLNHVKALCQTPIRGDPEYGASTCTQIEHAGQSYHNYQRFLGAWNQEASNGNGTSEQVKRPQAFAMLYENTTVTGQWIHTINTTEVSQRYERAVNNVTMAFPHTGVFQAARDQRNQIMQPEELNSEGSYFLRASVPSPVMNVLCVNMNETELAPIVYTTWRNETVTGSSWMTQKNHATTVNNTLVDELFGWTKEDKALMRDYPPVFARYPGPFNTILNNTSTNWGRSPIYLLGQGGGGLEGQYVLCSIRMTVSPFCSTQYNVTGSGGSMQALCGDNEETADDQAYIKSNASAPDTTLVPNWRDVGTEWSNSLSLNTGIDDGNASNSRLLTQLILQPSPSDPTTFDLNPALPSVAEALLSMSGGSLLKSMQDTPFVPFYNYTAPLLDNAQTQFFNATVKAQQYGSGGVDTVSKGWLIILLLVFLLNVFVLVYFLSHRGGLVTDFSEPPNLFALAVNSPPSHLLAGSCGGGPEGKQYMVNWFVNTEGDHLYMEPNEKEMLAHAHDGHHHHHGHVHGRPHVHPRPDSGHGSARSVPHASTTAGGVGANGAGANAGAMPGFVNSVSGGFSRLRERGLRFGRRADKGVSQEQMRTHSPYLGAGAEAGFELEDGTTRAQRQYAKLAKRRSMFS